MVATNDVPQLEGEPAVLDNGSEDVVYTIYESDLLKGYTDGDANSNLSITGVMATAGLPATTMTAHGPSPQLRITTAMSTSPM